MSHFKSVVRLRKILSFLFQLVAQYLMDSKRFPCEISRLAQNIQLFSASVLQLGLFCFLDFYFILMHVI